MFAALRSMPSTRERQTIFVPKIAVLAQHVMIPSKLQMPCSPASSFNSSSHHRLSFCDC